MRISPFLPGLILALAAWILPLVLRPLPAQVRSSIAARVPWLNSWAPWIRSIGLLYLGLLLGWISSRDFGLTGHTAAEWVAGAAAAVGLGILLGRISNRLSIGFGWGVVGDEARWTLYRAAVWPWVRFLPLAVLAAFAAGWAEFAIGRRLGGGKIFDGMGLLFLLHAACSAVLFLLAHNVFLAMLFYAAAVAASAPDLRQRLSAVLEKARGR